MVSRSLSKETIGNIKAFNYLARGLAIHDTNDKEKVIQRERARTQARDNAREKRGIGQYIPDSELCEYNQIILRLKSALSEEVPCMPFVQGNFSREHRDEIVAEGDFRPRLLFNHLMQKQLTPQKYLKPKLQFRPSTTTCSTRGLLIRRMWLSSATSWQGQDAILAQPISVESSPSVTLRVSKERLNNRCIKDASCFKGIMCEMRLVCEPYFLNRARLHRTYQRPKSCMLWHACQVALASRPTQFQRIRNLLEEVRKTPGFLYLRTTALNPSLGIETPTAD